MSPQVAVLFDLDGVIVDNCEFERDVTDFLVRRLSEANSISMHAAALAWDACLRRNAANKRWHDYAIHCNELGLGESWKDAHEAAKKKLRKIDSIDSALIAADRIGPKYIVSDATHWVVEFKLNAAGISTSTFKDIFSLDKCGVSKGHEEYWQAIKKFACLQADRCIYIDNRVDRLIKASEVLTRAILILVNVDDHPMSLGIFAEVAHGKQTIESIPHPQLSLELERLGARLTELASMDDRDAKSSCQQNLLG